MRICLLYSLFLLHFYSTIMHGAEPVKKLLLPGESFLLNDKAAFILWPEESKRHHPQPWVLYAPTLSGFPDKHETWMHQQFLKAGIAVAGIDIGEAYGSPLLHQHLDNLYIELTTKRNFATKLALLGRSRGGLWISSWASANVDKVSSLSGIYPVFDLRTYPGLQKASVPYELTAQQLEAEINLHNPINKVDLLAKANIPAFLIHGDEDKVVPLKENSQEFYQRYAAQGLETSVNLAIIKGQGHNFWPGFFHSQQLVDFTIEHAQQGAGIKPGNKNIAKLPATTLSFSDIPYSKSESTANMLDVYMPKVPHDPLPVVIWIHGGGWANGSKARSPATWLVEHGFAVVSINYRLTGEAIWPAQIDDCRAAIRWVREHAQAYGFDGNSIGLWGGSAGGHLVALLGTLDAPAGEKISSRVQAVCDWYGPSDLLTMPSNVLTGNNSLEDLANSNGAKLLGGIVKDRPELAKQASAIYHVSKDDPPFLIIHGDLDSLVPLEQSNRLHEQLQAAQVQSTLKVLPGAGHGGKEFQTPETREIILKFFQQKLTNAQKSTE